MVRIDHHEYLTEEEQRLKQDKERTKYWKKWGPYVAERQWATGSYFYSLCCEWRTDFMKFARTTVRMVMRGAVSDPGKIGCRKHR